jgi:hypothetical protein
MGLFEHMMAQEGFFPARSTDTTNHITLDNAPKGPSKGSEAIGRLRECLRKCREDQRALAAEGQNPIAMAKSNKLAKKMTIFCMLRAWWHGRIHGQQVEFFRDRKFRQDVRFLPAFIDKYKPGRARMLRSLGDVRTYIEQWTGKKRGVIFEPAELEAIRDVLDLRDAGTEDEDADLECIKKQIEALQEAPRQLELFPDIETALARTAETSVLAA